MKEKRFDLVAFDVDGTLVDDTVFIWQTLHDHFQTDPVERKRVADQYFSGVIDYNTWFDTDIRALIARGADRAGFEAVVRRMRAMPGSRETLAALRAAGLVVGVISGSLDIVLDQVFGREPFDDVLINRIAFDAAGQLAAWTPTPFDLQDKARGLEYLAEKHGVALERTAFVGDHFNDIEAVRRAGLGIAFNCKSDALAAVADVVVEGRDLRAVLPLIL